MKSREFFSSSCANWSKICATALVATSLAVGGSAFGQSFSTTFDEGTGTYPQPQGSLSGQNGWDTNDAAKTGAASYVGQSDYVGQVMGYAGSSAANYQGALGGLFHGTGANQDEPGAATVYLFHAFSPGSATSYVINTDLDIAYPAAGTAGASFTRDSFGFNFQTSGLANLFSLNLTPDTSGLGNSANQMTIGYTVAGTGTTNTVNALVYNSIYHLRISVNVTAKTMTIVLTGSTNSFTISNVSLATTNPASLGQVASTWTLTNTTQDTNGGYTNAGSNALVFDNFSIAVPEPSTWALLGAGVFGLAAYARRRVRA